MLIARIVVNGVPTFLYDTQITFSTKIHGGYEKASVKGKLSSRINASRIETFYFQELLITDEHRQPLFDGRVMGISNDGFSFEIDAVGYGITATNDLLYQSTSTVQANVSVIMAEILSTIYCPELSSTQLISTNTTQAIRKSDHAEYPFEIATRLCSLSDSANSMWTFGVWEDKKPFYYDVFNGSYRQNWILKDGDNYKIDYSTSGENMRNSIRVVYQDVNNNQQTSAYVTSVQTGYPTRQAEFSLPTAVTVSQATNRLLTQNKQPTASLQIQLIGTIQKKYAGRFPVEYIRAGDFIDISRFKLTAIENTIDLKNVLIVATHFDGTTMTLTPGV